MDNNLHGLIAVNEAAMAQLQSIQNMSFNNTAEMREIPLQPLRGRHIEPVKELMEIPKKITMEHLGWAERILQQRQIVARDLLEDPKYIARRTGFRDEDIEEWGNVLKDEFVKYAVCRQWRQFEPKKFLKLCEQKGKTTKRGNTLYNRRFKIPMYGYRPQWTEVSHWYVGYKCPSTGKLYVSEVPHQAFSSTRLRKADAAMAWKFSMSLKEYDDLKVEA